MLAPILSRSYRNDGPVDTARGDGVHEQLLICSSGGFFTYLSLKEPS